MSVPISLKYRAFLSYAHANVGWGKWLHGQLENFRIDKDLVGRDTRVGPVPKSLRPIFRDREDFVGGHILTEATVAALDQSAALIVLCSAISATRPAVNEEVRLFRSRHPNRPVIPVIVGGSYPDNFPPALRFELAPGGEVTDQPLTILGPDLRESGDGRPLGLAKVVAGLIGVGTDEIVRRSQQAARRRLRNWIAGLSLVVFALAGLATWAEFNRREAVAQREAAEVQRARAERDFAAAKKAVDGLIGNIAEGFQDVKDISSATIHKVLDTLKRTVDELAATEPGDKNLQTSRMAMLTDFSRTYLKAGDKAAAKSAAEESVIIARGFAKDSSDKVMQRHLSIALWDLGTALENASDATGALAAYQESSCNRY